MTDATDSSTLTAAVPAGLPKRRRRLTPVSVGVLCLWAAVFLAGTAGGLYKWTTGYQRHVLGALNENVRYVEIEPEPGGPPVRLTSPRDIARLRGILTAAARRQVAGRFRPTAPPVLFMAMARPSSSSSAGRHPAGPARRKPGDGPRCDGARTSATPTARRSDDC